ncbi:MAG: hypothetical protein HYS98_08485 [Deltaproteobacteria bacterium]|nr:hypothetical protein [Deltaproteobacteria bacterium]
MKTNLTLWSHENRFYFGVEHNSTTLEDSIVKILNPLSTSSGVEEIFKSAAGEEIISITEPTSY